MMKRRTSEKKTHKEEINTFNKEYSWPEWLMDECKDSLESIS